MTNPNRDRAVELLTRYLSRAPEDSLPDALTMDFVLAVEEIVDCIIAAAKDPEGGA